MEVGVGNSRLGNFLSHGDTGDAVVWGGDMGVFSANDT